MLRKIGLIDGIMPGVAAHVEQLIRRSADARRCQVQVLVDDVLTLPNLHNIFKHHPRQFVTDIAKRSRALSMRGATHVFMPSMIAQTCYDEVQKRSSKGVQVVNLVDMAMDGLNGFSANTTFGVMCHNATWEEGLFQNAFKKRGLKLVDASSVRAPILMHTSTAVDAVRYRDLEAARRSIRAAGKMLQQAGAQVILLGSAALPLAWPIDGLDVPLVNPLQVAVDRLLEDLPRVASAISSEMPVSSL